MSLEESAVYDAVVDEHLTTFHLGPPPYVACIDVVETATGVKRELLLSKHLNERGMKAATDGIADAIRSGDSRAVFAFLCLCEAETRVITVGMRRWAGEA